MNSAIETTNILEALNIITKLQMATVGQTNEGWDKLYSAMRYLENTYDPYKAAKYPPTMFERECIESILSVLI